MACCVISMAKRGLPTRYCIAFLGLPTVRRSAPWLLVLNSMKPLGPTMDSSLALTAAGSPPSSRSLYTSGSKRPSCCSNIAVKSSKDLSAVRRTCSTSMRDWLMVSLPMSFPKRLSGSRWGLTPCPLHVPWTPCPLEDHQEIARHLEGRYGKLDILVNNAGV